MEAKFETIDNEDFFAWVAPDGTVQVSTLAPDKEMTFAFARMLAKKGLGKSPSVMIRDGFRIDRVRLTIKRHENQKWNPAPPLTNH